MGRRMRIGIAVVLGAMLASPAFAEDKPLPDGIKIVPESAVATCTFVDMFSEMRFAMTSATKTQRKAMIAALEKAKKAGADTAVMSSTTAHNNQHQITVMGYKCANPAGS